MDGPKEGGEDMPIDSVIQSVRQSQIRQLPLFLSLPLCESRNFYSVRARPEKCGISRDLRLCSIHDGRQDGGKWKVIKWNPHSLFSPWLQSRKPGEPVDRNLWRTSFFKIEALLCPTHGQTGGAELFILNL